MSGRKRAYDSQLRSARAADTRRRVLLEAARLFAQHGYERTTLADIASAADVSVELIQKLGPKASVFRASMEIVTLGDQDSLRDAARRLDEVESSAGPEVLLHRVAVVTTKWNQRSAALWSAWGAASDPGLRRSWEDVMAAIRQQWEVHLTRWLPHGWLRTDVGTRELAVGVWVLTLAETYDRLVVVAGLSLNQYRQWLERALGDLLLDRRRSNIGPRIPRQAGPPTS